MRAVVDRAVEELARTQFGVFSRDHAMRAGFTRHQIQNRVDNELWLRVAPAVYALPGWPRTLEQRAMVAHLHAGPGSFLSFRCGALLRGADGVRNAPVEITVPRRLRRIPDVHIHYATDATIFDWSMVGPLPVATVTRIVVDLCATGASLDVLERVFEWGHRHGHTDPGRVREALERLGRRGKPGIARLRALDARLVRDGKRNGSEAETRFFQILRDADLPLPTRQKLVLRDDGSHAYTDYAYDGIDAVLEILGYAHHSSRKALDRDAERNNDLNLERKTVLEFTWTHLESDRDYIVRTVRRLLRDNKPL